MPELAVSTWQAIVPVAWMIFCGVMLFRSQGSMTWYVAMFVGAWIVGRMVGIDWSLL